MESLIQVEQLYRYYGDHCAVKDVNLEIGRGEVVGFLGPNGAGKSTTMQVISGNLAPSSGRVRINGYDILDQPKMAKADLGYLPEKPPLYADLTVDEYLFYCARFNRIVPGKRDGAVTSAKLHCGLDEVGSRLIGNLSKGFQQRVGIAQAIIHSPSVVILDEPTVGLDPIQIREIRELIRNLGASHSVILSTHILPEVQAVCDRVQILHKGRLVYSNTVAGLQHQKTGSTLMVAFKRQPSVPDLESIEGVDNVEPCGNGRFRIAFKTDVDPAEGIVERSVAWGWGLYELSPETISLEQIFIDITCSEQDEGGIAGDYEGDAEEVAA